MPRDISFVTKHLENASSLIVDGELKSYREDTEKRACLMTEAGPIWLEIAFTDDGWSFSASFPDGLQATFNEFDPIENGPLEVE